MFHSSRMSNTPPDSFLLIVWSLLCFAADRKLELEWFLAAFRKLEGYFLPDCPSARSQAWLLWVLHGWTNGCIKQNVLRYYRKTCKNENPSSQTTSADKHSFRRQGSGPYLAKADGSPRARSRSSGYSWFCAKTLIANHPFRTSAVAGCERRRQIDSDVGLGCV